MSDSEPESEPEANDVPAEATSDDAPAAPKDAGSSSAQPYPYLDLGLLLLGVGAVLFFGLSSFGIWDPWELDRAEAARQAFEGRITRPLATGIISMFFGVFGTNEFAGRLPIVLCALGSLAAGHALVFRVSKSRFAAMAGMLAAASTPLFVLNARQMLGEAPAVLAQALLALAVFELIWRKKEQPYVPLALAVVAGAALAISGAGAILCALPPLVAGTLLAGADGRLVGERADRGAQIVAGTAVVITALTVSAIFRDEFIYNVFTGGIPRGDDPPTFEVLLEHVFHGFAPWSGVLLLAAGFALAQAAKAESEPSEEHPYRPAPDAEPAYALSRRQALGLFAAAWMALSYAGATLFASRYGPASFLGVIPMGILVGLFLESVRHEDRGFWGIGVIACLFTGLLIRDFGLYPGSPLGALPVEGVEVPEVFNPKRYWTAGIGVFAIAALLGFIGGPKSTELDARAPIRLLKSHWQRGVGAKVWVVLGALLIVSLFAAGVLLLVLGEGSGVTTVVLKAKWPLILLPVLIPLGIFAAQAIYTGASKLGQHRFVPLLAAGCICGVYVAHGWQPELSTHFSPRRVFDRFNSLAGEGEPLVDYRVNTKAARYYAKVDVERIREQSAFVEYFRSPERRWALLDATELAQVDLAYRGRDGDHLFIADARSARVLLATNQPIEGMENESFLAKYVLREAPEIEFPVAAQFDRGVSFLGYDAVLPHDGYVGPGEKFTMRWYWKTERSNPGNYKVFVHIDGRGQRMNGDREVLDGRYPVRLWRAGDIVVDEQEFTVPAHYRPGRFNVMIGMFSGSRRLELKSGPGSENRLRAGTLRIK